MGQPKFTTIKDLKDYLDLLPKEMDDYRVNIHIDHNTHWEYLEKELDRNHQILYIYNED